MRFKLKKKHGFAALLFTVGFVMIPIPPEGPDIAFVLALAPFLGFTNAFFTAVILGLALMGLAIVVARL